MIHWAKLVPVHRAGDPGLNPGPGKIFSLKLLIFYLSEGYSKAEIFIKKLITSYLHFCRIFSGCHIILSLHAGRSGTGMSHPTLLLSLYANNIPNHSCHIELSQYADNNVPEAMSMLSALMV
jgi:hypothetical protein